MAERMKWTEDQQRAIDSRGEPILVSAAAGSGKTAVLVARVLEHLTEHAPIDRYLLVTFTNAAASEMRAKLGEKLAAKLAADPTNAFLQRQILLLPKADITTVDSFCMKLVREHADEIGIAPDFRIIDENEGKQLAEQIVQAVIDEAYEIADPDFLSLSDLLTAGQNDDRLAAIVLEIARKVSAHADPIAFLGEIRQALCEKEPLAQSVTGRMLFSLAEEDVSYGLQQLRRAIRELEEMDDELTPAYLPALLHDEAQAQTLLDAIRAGDWDAAVEAAAAVSFDRLGQVRGYENEWFKEQIKALREIWKKLAGEVRERRLCATEAQNEYDRAIVDPALCALIDLTKRFLQTYEEEKRNRHGADFSDIEHYAVRLLYGADGKYTPLAQGLSERYVEVMVDEYQDTNGVQDALFRALSDDGRKLFLVGDIKQSIYSFRLADPSLFLARYQAAQDDPQPGDTRRVVLNRNFRSHPKILRMVNYLFRQVMSERVGSLDYTAREALYPGRTDVTEDSWHDVELLLADTGELEDTDNGTYEARVIADRIRALLDEGHEIFDGKEGRMRPLQPRDIVILLRSPAKRGTALREALTAVGVPVRAEEKSGLLGTAEVGTIVSLLNILDNPRQDIELVGVLRSPLYGFTEERLGEIRLKDTQNSFYDALRLAAETDADCADFCNTLAELRLLAADVPLYQLIWEIYTRIGALGLFAGLPEGEQRRQNLLSFLERARAFEESGMRGLYRFVGLLRSMTEHEDDFQVVRAQGSRGAVNILSIHKSKGLEYPVVILGDCGGQFNLQDLNAPVLIHPKLGAAGKCRDLNRKVEYSTLDRQCFAASLLQDSLSEELRILYVALTRPREKLILAATAKNMKSKIADAAEVAREGCTPYHMGRVRTFLGWILPALLRHPAASALAELCEYEPLTPDPNAEADLSISYYNEEITLQKREEAEAETAEGEIEAPALTAYPYAELVDQPAKLTATGLKHDYKSTESAEETRLPRPPRSLRTPDFERDRTALTPAEQGTAHHLFLQFCDFAVCAAGDVIGEIARLREEHILSERQTDALKAPILQRFFGSKLYAEFAQAKVRREFKFSVVLPAADYSDVTDPQETVLLQGVVDCLLETAEGFTVIDFKTDRVTEQSAAARAEEYRPQLDAYARAVTEIFERPVVARKLFFLHTGQTITL